ncbi:MAG TPA: phytoene dehydrogenase, partial [Bacteroidia bacterium]|nr:phytoene dehydrogenase [Bacteroidia bacterium]
SVDVSDWFAPGMNGKRAVDCMPNEIRDEVWAQMKIALNQGGKQVLQDDQVVTWFSDLDLVDPSVVAAAPPGSKTYIESDDEPLFVNTVSSWNLRPEAHTAIANMFLASDYVRTYTDLACMESANEAARRAVNCILDVSGSKAALCEVWNLHEPCVLAPFRWEDTDRFKKGLPWKPELSLITRICIAFMHLGLKIYAFLANKKR